MQPPPNAGNTRMPSHDYVLVYSDFLSKQNQNTLFKVVDYTDNRYEMIKMLTSFL